MSTQKVFGTEDLFVDAECCPRPFVPGSTYTKWLYNSNLTYVLYWNEY